MTTGAKHLPEISISETSTPDPGVTVSELALGPAPVNAAFFSVDPASASGIDSHSVHEIWMVASGEGELVYDGQVQPLRANDVFRFEPQLTHQVRNPGPEPIVIFSIWW